MITVTITADTPKEMADLALALQNRPESKRIFLDKKELRAYQENHPEDQ